MKMTDLGQTHSHFAVLEPNRPFEKVRICTTYTVPQEGFIGCVNTIQLGGGILQNRGEHPNAKTVSSDTPCRHGLTVEFKDVY